MNVTWDDWKPTAELRRKFRLADGRSGLLVVSCGKCGWSWRVVVSGVVVAVSHASWLDGEMGAAPQSEQQARDEAVLALGDFLNEEEQ